MRVRSTLLGFVALVIGCAPPQKSTIDSVEQSLAARNLKVIGSLSYGQTSSVVAYSSPPRYFAFSFNGAADDTVEIFVRSPDHSGQPAVLLVDGNLNDLVYQAANDSASAAHIVFKLPASPTFYIAFRTADKRSANLTVQLIGPPKTYQDTRIAQTDIDAGKFTPSQLNLIGDVLFGHTFTVDEGAGNALVGGPAGNNARPNGRKIHNGKFGGPDNIGGSCETCHSTGGDDGAGPNDNNIFQDGDGVNVASALVRNPIALLGNGYVQELGIEMSTELQAQRTLALSQAKTNNQPFTQNLNSKGVDFGSLIANPDGTVDSTGITGVDADLVVKPFGWKGRVPTLRRFVEGGFQVHFGMATEVLVASNCKKAIPGVVGNGPDCHDPDADGVYNEITEGQLTSMALYATLRQAPVRVNPKDPVALDRVFDGEDLFSQVGCASCHTPSMTLNNPIHVEVPDLTGGTPFQVDLTADVEAPRLHSCDDGTVNVELFSDLKRHDLGAALHDPHNTFVVFPANLFLTPPLWGVAATAPYLHDGRAATLADAIAAHDGEAASSRQQFQALSSDDQLKLIEFLGTLSRDPKHIH
jgi:hypothetical protein